MGSRTTVRRKKRLGRQRKARKRLLPTSRRKNEKNRGRVDKGVKGNSLWDQNVK